MVKGYAYVVKRKVRLNPGPATYKYGLEYVCRALVWKMKIDISTSHRIIPEMFSPVPSSMMVTKATINL